MAVFAREKYEMIEKQLILEDDSVIHYAEGPDNGPALLLLHGQQVSWEDYRKVLPELSKQFHVFAVDYYGHGGSSKDPAKYTAKAIGTDLLCFIHMVIRKKPVIAGHSSGALLAAWMAGNDPDGVAGIVLEDGPFFSTEKGRAEHTFAWLGFEVIHRFLQEEETNYTLYSLEHHYMQTLFNQNGKDNWERIVLNPAKKYMKKHPGTIPKIWYYPKKLGINSIYALTANLQDGTGDYDLRFGETFYNFSWFEGFDQEETLSKIICPALVLHVAPGKATAPGYYDKNGILLSAMDEKDAARVTKLIENSEYVGGFASMHNIHDDLPDAYIDQLLAFKERLAQRSYGGRLS